MQYSRQHVAETLRHSGMREIADLAEETLPDPVDSPTLDEFCTAHGISMSTLTDRMGASP